MDTQKLLMSMLVASALLMNGALILDDVNVTDVTQTLKDIIGIVPPVLFAMIAVVIAIGVMIMIMAITGLLPKVLNSLIRKLDRL